MIYSFHKRMSVEYPCSFIGTYCLWCSDRIMNICIMKNVLSQFVFISWRFAFCHFNNETSGTYASVNLLLRSRQASVLPRSQVPFNAKSKSTQYSKIETRVFDWEGMIWASGVCGTTFLTEDMHLEWSIQSWSWFIWAAPTPFLNNYLVSSKYLLTKYPMTNRNG